MKNKNSPEIKNKLSFVFLNGWRPYAWLAVVGFAVYAQTLFFGLSGYDDTLLITRHYYLIKDITKIPAAFLNDVAWGHSQQFYRPMLTVSFMFNAILGGKNIWFFHLSNILMHLGSVLLAFWLLKRLTGERGSAFILSLIFAVHPALSPAVAWLPGRNDSLLGLFTLGAFGAMLEYVRNGKWRWYALHLTLFVFALFTKETAVAIPAVFLAFLIAIYGRQRLRQCIYLAAGWLASGAGYFLLRGSVLPPTPPIMNTASENAAGLLGYIGKLIFPVNLSVMPMPQDSPYFYGIAALALFVILFALKGIRNKKIFIAGLFWFTVFLVPTIFRITDFANMLEHRLYVPMFGLLLMLSQAEAIRHFKKIFLALAVFLLVLFGAFAVSHSRDFKDPLSFWQNAADTSPHCALAHRSLGMMHLNWGQPEKAALRFGQGLKNNPGDPGLMNGLALAYLNMNKFDLAVPLLEKAAVIDSGNAFCHENLGTAYLKIGRLRPAVQEFRRAHILRPEDPGILLNLSYAHYSLKDVDSAAYYYSRALKHGLAPDPKIEKMLRNTTEK